MITPSRKRGQYLKFEDRVCIKIYRKLKYTLRAIVDVLDCSPFVIAIYDYRGIKKMMKKNKYIVGTWSEFEKAHL